MARAEAWQHRERLTGSNVKLGELLGGHDYSGHTTRSLGHSEGTCPERWAAPCSLTDDLLCTWCRSLIRTLPSHLDSLLWQDAVGEGLAGRANLDSSHGGWSSYSLSKGLLFWHLGKSPLDPWADLTPPTA